MKKVIVLQKIFKNVAEFDSMKEAKEFVKSTKISQSIKNNSEFRIK